MPFADPTKGFGFYICAHQDDWIGMRGEQAYQDLQLGNVGFIFITAGDAGLTDGWWNAREQGVLAAIGTGSPPSPFRLDIKTVVGVNAHQISRFSNGSTVTYCLRLPDAPNTPNLESLLNDSPHSVSLQAVDGSAVYSSWDDLCKTIEAIVVEECTAAGRPQPWINSSLYRSDAGRFDDPASSGVNPGDHSDHTAAGLAVHSFASRFCSRAWWWGYAIYGRDTPPTDWRITIPATLADKKLLWDTYGNTVKALYTRSGSPSDWKPWVDGIDGEWATWGGYSHSELAPFGTPDPYP